MISSGDAKKVLLLNNSTQRTNKPTTKSWSWTINVTHHMRIQFDIDPKFQNRKFGYLSLSTFSIRTSKYQWLSLMSCCTFLVCSTIHLRKTPLNTLTIVVTWHWILSYILMITLWIWISIVLNPKTY